MPAILPFPDRGSLLIRASEEGRDKANEVLQAAMLRFLTSIPPGKVRFTIIDPVGLGENFAAFMHLADYSELLVTSRIWTETPHIEQRLADLSAHMENVIQKYLRNEFETIEEYNVHAGEVAEPFRVLVVANFPANFSEAAARRLISIVTSGARCGVYTLMSVDTKQPVPGRHPAEGPRAALRQPRLEGRAAPVEGPRLRAVPAPARRAPRPRPVLAHPPRRRRARPRRQPRRGPLRVHRPEAGRSTGPGTAARGSTSPSAAPAPPSCSTWPWARGRRSTS